MSLAKIIWSSHADLSGSGPHKLISLCQALIHRHSLLAAVSCSTLIISLRLVSRASLSSPFKSLLRWSPLFSRSDSLWYGVRVVQSTLQVGAQLLKLWYRVLEALLYLLLTRVIWSSHADLFGSGPHKLIALPLTLSRHSRWRQCHAATSIISLRLGSSASLSSPFSSYLLCCFPLFSLSVLLVFSLGQQWLHEPTCNVEIIYRAQMGQDVYTEYARTIYINIYINKYI